LTKENIITRFKRALRRKEPDKAMLQISQQVWRLSLPAVVEMVMVSLVSVINMMMVSRLGAAEISAVGLIQQPVNLALTVVVSLNVGITAIVARALGAEHPELVDRAFSQALLFSGALGILIGAVFAGSAIPIATFMGGQGEVIPLATTYLRIISVSMPLFTLSSTVLAALRGAGDARTALQVNSIANVLVVVFGLPLIYGYGPLPRLGVAGAAYGLVLARVYMITVSMIAVNSRRAKVRFRLQRPFFHRILLRETLRVGIPSAVEQLLLQSGLIFFVRSVAMMGTTVLAAHQIVSNITNLSWQPASGFAVAATALSGQYLGAGKPQDAEFAIRRAQRFGQVVAWSMLCIFLFLGRYIIGLYTTDPTVIEMAIPALCVVALVQPSQSTQIIYSGGLRGAGATVEPLMSTAFGIWVVRNVVLAITVRLLNLGLMGAWLAIAVDQLSRYLFIGYLFRRGRWKYVRMGLSA
jgi:putative MATE family efflux protein